MLDWLHRFSIRVNLRCFPVRCLTICHWCYDVIPNGERYLMVWFPFRGEVYHLCYHHEEDPCTKHHERL